MESLIRFFCKIPHEYFPQIKQSISNAAAVLSDPNAGSEAHDAILHDLDQLHQTVGLDVVEAWKNELAAKLGIEPSAMERVLQMAEQARGRLSSPLAQKIGQHLKWWWWKDALAALGSVLVIGAAQQGSRNAGDLQTLLYQQDLEIQMSKALNTTQFDEEMNELAQPDYPSRYASISIPPSIAVVPVRVNLEIAHPVVPATQLIARLPDESAQRKAVDIIEHANNSGRSVEFTPSRLNLPSGVSLGSSFGSFSIH
jgi:hypothetical protein